MLFGFLGPNGAGKTTTIRVLLGFLRPEAGAVKIFGLDCWKDTKAIKRDTGYLPGDLRLPHWMNAEKALSIYGAVRGIDLRPAGSALCDKFDLDPQVKVRDMSRGMRQKLGLVIALAHSPRLLILDEPTSGLDPLIQQILHRTLRDLARAGHTIFFSSHSLFEVEQLCERIAIVRNGTIVADETLAALRDRAGYDVTIRWADKLHASRLAAPSFLKLTRTDNELWEGMLSGPAERLIDFLHGRPVLELLISRPDLESLFRRFYQHEGEAAL